IFGVFVLSEDHFRLETEDGTAGSEQQRLEGAAVLAIVDLGELFPDRTVFDFFHNTFEDYSFVGFFRANNTMRIGSDVFRLACAGTGAEPESVLPPDAPDKHEVGPAVGASGGNPIVVRFFEALEGPRPWFEAGRLVGWILQGVGPMGTAALGFG